jgi:type IV pilus assembly protein PilO
MNEYLDRLFALERNQRLAIYAGTLLVLAGLFWYLYYGPSSRAVAEKTEQLETLKADQVKKTRLVARLDQYRQEVRDLDAQLRQALAQLPDQKEIPDLLSTVSSVGRESGLEIVLFRQRPESYQDFYAEVPVEMLMRGSYSQVTTFLDKVGSLNRIVNVTDITMKSPVITDGRVSLDTSCTAVTFRFLSEEERARIAAEKAAKK